MLNPCSPVPFTQQIQNRVLISFFWRMSMQHRSCIATGYTIQWRHQNSVSDLFKVINTDTRHQNNLIDVVLVSLLQSRFHTLFWCFHCELWTSKYGLGKLKTSPARNRSIMFNFYFLRITVTALFVCKYVMRCAIWYHL